ncbi:hypothetical protein SAMN05421663_104156 [Terribacillus halophilus]|uniref:Helix-turn-helix domain-containing protein n=1 Tax=Terribacillus halophilus TaxID=361279 RepID=A0A1G6PLT8_9BACI|nr:hypothetical protein [Terribacillus halophilus]SDC80325.1 hypothetical protein SAMN05421663_104156 [Terribacillus halophilus]
MQQSNLTNFKSYSQFKTLKQFNSSNEQYFVDIIKDKLLSKSEIIALKALIRHCATVFGVSNARQCKIVSSTHKDGIGISLSTFKRAINKAKKIGMLNVHALSRKNGSQSSNLYVFNPYPQKQKERVNKRKLTYQNNTNNLLNLSNLKDKKRNQPILLAALISDRVPREFANLAKSFFTDGKYIECLWSKVEVAAYRNLFEEDRNIQLQTSLSALKQAVRGKKLGFIKTTFVQYFYGVLEKKFNELAVLEQLRIYNLGK